VFGALPGEIQALQGLADGLAPEETRRPTEPETRLGYAIEGPQAGGLTVQPRAVRQEIFQGRGKVLGKEGTGGVRPGGLRFQTVQPLGVEGLEGVAGRAGRAGTGSGAT
jgi:hypothetical protein